MRPAWSRWNPNFGGVRHHKLRLTDRLMGKSSLRNSWLPTEPFAGLMVSLLRSADCSSCLTWLALDRPRGKGTVMRCSRRVNIFSENFPPLVYSVPSAHASATLFAAKEIIHPNSLHYRPSLVCLDDWPFQLLQIPQTWREGKLCPSL